jgi:predicted nucleic acid-binding Zn ribbon protein
MNDITIPCLICGDTIQQGQEMYACTINREYMSDPGKAEYTLLDSGIMLTACKNCYEQHNLVKKVETALYAEVHYLPELPSERLEEEANTHYSCLNCGEPIPNGKSLVTIVQSLETFEGQVFKPSKTWLSYHACELCAEVLGLDTRLSKAINAVIEDSLGTIN